MKAFDDKPTSMKTLSIPIGPDRPSWASLLGAVPALYVFWDPVRYGALPLEWTLTVLAFLVFVALLALAAVHWSRERVMQQVCLAMAVLGVAFALYRPSGILYFVFVAGVGPLAMGGRAPGSAAIIGSAMVLITAVWWLRWPPDVMPYVVAIQALLIGSAITLVFRQQMRVRQALKTAERERIARDLHDILGHTLSVITLKAELAGRVIDRDPQRAKAEIRDVENISRGALSEVREAISGYRGRDLRTELARAKATLETAGIAVEDRIESVVIPPAHERVMALVLREAVTNVVRHAAAERCVLTLERHGDTLRLVVRDDGRGGNHDVGLGMHGIAERVAAIGGRASWRTDAGTELTVSLPATPQSATRVNED